MGLENDREINESPSHNLAPIDKHRQELFENNKTSKDICIITGRTLGFPEDALRYISGGKRSSAGLNQVWGSGFNISCNKNCSEKTLTIKNIEVEQNSPLRGREIIKYLYDKYRREGYNQIIGEASSMLGLKGYKVLPRIGIRETPEETKRLVEHLIKKHGTLESEINKQGRTIRIVKEMGIGKSTIDQLQIGMVSKTMLARAIEKIIHSVDNNRGKVSIIEELFSTEIGRKLREAYGITFNFYLDLQNEEDVSFKAFHKYIKNKQQP